jgi:hypothetical protein
MHNIEKTYIRNYICLVHALFAWNSINTVRFPYGADYGEATLMDQVRLIDNSGTLFKSNINDPPTVITNYPPLYPSWVAAIKLIYKISLLQAGRITSILFSLISGFIIGLFTYQLTGNNIKVHVAGLDGIVMSNIFIAMKVLSDQPGYYQPFAHCKQYYTDLWETPSSVNQFKKRQFPVIIVGGNTLNTGSS